MGAWRINLRSNQGTSAGRSPDSGSEHQRSPQGDLPVLQEILDSRENQYGSAHQNFALAGRGWGAILGIDDIPAWKVALCLDFFKSIRCVANPAHEDSWLDKLGYTQHGKEIALTDEP